MMDDDSRRVGTVQFTELDALAIRVERLEQRLALLEALTKARLSTARPPPAWLGKEDEYL